MSRLRIYFTMTLFIFFAALLTPTALLANINVQKAASSLKNADPMLADIKATGGIEIVSSMVELGELTPGATGKAALVIQNNHHRAVWLHLNHLPGWRTLGKPLKMSYRELTSGDLNLELSVARDEFFDTIREVPPALRLRLTIGGMGESISFLRELPPGPHSTHIPLEIDGEPYTIKLFFSLTEKLSTPGLFIYPRTLDLGAVPGGEKVSRRLTIRNMGAGALRWTTAIPPKAFATSKDITQRGRFLSLSNSDVKLTGIYILPRHLRDHIDLTGRWSEEGGYPRGFGPVATIKYRFTGTAVGLVNLRKSDDASLAFFINDIPSPAIKRQEEETGILDNVKIMDIPDGKHTLTIVVTEGSLLMEGFRTFDREVLRLPEGTVTLAPRRGVSTTESDFVTINIDTGNLGPGYYVDFVEIASNGGAAVLPIYVEITPPGPTGLIDVHLFFKDRARMFSSNPLGDAHLVSMRGFQKHGIAFQLFPPDTPGTTEFFRWFNPRTGDYFYSHFKQGGGKDLSGYLFEGTIGNIATSRIAGTRPLHRWFNPTTRQHFFTVDPKGEGIRKHGFIYDGIAGFVR